MMYKFFIDADIAKDTIELAVQEGGQLLLQQQVENTKPGIQTFLQKIKTAFKAASVTITTKSTILPVKQPINDMKSLSG